MATSKKKPTAAQLAARKLFAQRAKAGTLKKATKRKPAAKRAKNPAPSNRQRAEARLFTAKENAVEKLRNRIVYAVECSKNKREWRLESLWADLTVAEAAANEYANFHPSDYVRVSSHKIK